MRWRPAKAGSDAYVDLLGLFPGATDSIVAARTRVEAEEGGEWLFSLGSDDGVLVLANGREVWRLDQGRGYRLGQDMFRATMQEGENEILVLVHQRTGGWGMGVEAGPVAQRQGPGNVRAEGRDRRVDVFWEAATEPDWAGFRVEAAMAEDGPFETLVEQTTFPCWSHYVGQNGSPRYYRVTKQFRDGTAMVAGRVVSATPAAMGEDQLLTYVQEATFRYFWDYGHPVSGLARERLGSRDICTTGGTGFGLMAMCVAAERGFVSRREAAERVLRVVSFLQDKATRYHGAWPHWVNGRSGATRRFSEFDDGADIVETAFLIQGMLTARQYFDGGLGTEREIRRRVTALWHEVEWDWFYDPAVGQMRWHWSPNFGWKKNLRIGGHFNECMILYLLAAASPTHPVPDEAYRQGWIRDPGTYACGKTFHGVLQPAGWSRGGPLFFTHYSFLGFDPRGWRDGVCNYFDNNRAISQIHRAYCMENPKGYRGYGPDCWGLTSSDGPDGYRANAPGNRDTGTIAPTAALSAMPYVPAESRAALRHFYYDLGARLWGPFGFYDAFNAGRDWVAGSYLAIDQGPVIVMIENARTQLCWRLFMANPEIAPALERIGWERMPQ